MNNRGILKILTVARSAIVGRIIYKCEHDLSLRNVYHEDIELTISMFTRGKS